MITIPKRLIPAKDMAEKFKDKKKEIAIAEIQYRKRGALDPNYWDEVLRHVKTYFENVEKEEVEKDKYYMDALSQADRTRAQHIIDDLIGDLAHAYKEIQEQINYSRAGSHERTFWMYIRRELNKRRLNR